MYHTFFALAFIKALLFTDGGNSFDFQWNSVELHDHPLRPDNFETVTTEPGVLIIYPSYNKINSAPPQEYLDKSPVIEVGIDYDARAMEKPSDHCPVWLDLNE